MYLSPQMNVHPDVTESMQLISTPVYMKHRLEPCTVLGKEPSQQSQKLYLVFHF